MKLQEYINNPMGKGDASLGANRIVAVNILKEKYRILTNHKKIKMLCYKASLYDKYYIHLVIPTESERTNSYDVVFEFSTKEKDKSATGIDNYDVRVFSNSPSFAYTFAYVYAKNNIAIDYLISKKLGKTFVKQSPDMRNRHQIVNYEKYVFFGAMHIIESGVLNNRMKLDNRCNPTMMNIFPGRVRSLDDIMKEYEVAAAKLKKTNKVAKARELQKNKKEVKSMASGVQTITPRKKQLISSSSKSSIKHVKNISKQR